MAQAPCLLAAFAAASSAVAAASTSSAVRRRSTPAARATSSGYDVPLATTLPSPSSATWPPCDSIVAPAPPSVDRVWRSAPAALGSVNGADSNSSSPSAPKRRKRKLPSSSRKLAKRGGLGLAGGETAARLSPPQPQQRR